MISGDLCLLRFALPDSVRAGLWLEIGTRRLAGPAALKIIWNHPQSL